MKFASLMFLTVASSLAGCGGPATDSSNDTDTNTDTDTTVTFDDATIAAQLWDDVQGYSAWSQRDGWTTTPVLSGSHMGSFVVAYYNDVATAWDLQGTAPAGTIAVKEQYMTADDAAPSSLVVMKKIPGYDAAHGDWFWAMYGADGSVAQSGKVDMCIMCHGNVADQSDWVYGAPPTP